jgi:DNA-binding MarR family transcriptional regulator
MQIVMSRALQPLDLKTPHLDILVNLFRFEGLTQQELARKLLVGRSNMSMLLPQMEKRGLIERRTDESDKRVLRLYLTPQGRDLTEQAIAIQMQVIDRSMEISTPEECDMVGDVMNRMVASLKDELD